MRRLLLVALLLAPALAQAQAPEAVVGRWLALHVRGDAEASRDLDHGRLEQVLVIHPTGRAFLRGIDRVEAEGRPIRLGGQVSRAGRTTVLRLDERPGAAVLQREGLRLVVIDPQGRETVYVRHSPDDARHAGGTFGRDGL